MTASDRGPFLRHGIDHTLNNAIQSVLIICSIQ